MRKHFYKVRLEKGLSNLEVLLNGAEKSVGLSVISLEPPPSFQTDGFFYYTHENVTFETQIVKMSLIRFPGWFLSLYKRLLSRYKCLNSVWQFWHASERVYFQGADARAVCFVACTQRRYSALTTHSSAHYSAFFGVGDLSGGQSWAAMFSHQNAVVSLSISLKIFSAVLPVWYRLRLGVWCHGVRLKLTVWKLSCAKFKPKSMSLEILDLARSSD